MLLTTSFIRYRISFATRRIAADHRSFRYLWFRHGLFPAILECRRIINTEGTEVLYGENLFKAGCYPYLRIPIHSWPMGERCWEQLARLNITWHSSLAAQLALFPRLRYPVVHASFSEAQWMAFLRENIHWLERIPDILFFLAANPGLFLADDDHRRYFQERHSIVLKPPQTFYTEIYQLGGLDKLLREQCYARWRTGPYRFFPGPDTDYDDWGTLRLPLKWSTGE